MAKDLRFGEEARVLLLSGVDQLAEAVKSTFGPRAAMSSSRRSQARPW